MVNKLRSREEVKEPGTIKGFPEKPKLVWDDLLDRMEIKSAVETRYDEKSKAGESRVIPAIEVTGLTIWDDLQVTIKKGPDQAEARLKRVKVRVESRQNKRTGERVHVIPPIDVTGDSGYHEGSQVTLTIERKNSGKFYKA
ncbi:MAG: hypothetical protein V1744_01230 [Candidatus Altiarchaeota archaeon]